MSNRVETKGFNYKKIPCHSCKQKGFEILMPCPSCHWLTCKDCSFSERECKICYEKHHGYANEDTPKSIITYQVRGVTEKEKQ